MTKKHQSEDPYFGDARIERRGPGWRWLWPVVGSVAVLVAMAVLLYGVRIARSTTPIQAHAEKPAGDAREQNLPVRREKPDGPAPEGMVWIPGGQFWMGTDDPATNDAGPVHRVTRRRLLDGPDRGDQPAVRGIRRAPPAT